MTDTTLAHIVFVLDRSGSMDPLRCTAVDGFNRFLAKQASRPGRAVATLVQFADEVWTTWENIGVHEACLDDADYRPGGSTALFDAVAGTIDRVGARLAALPEERRPGKVIFAILTDGEENASRRYTAPDVACRIAHQSERYGWEFLFLGASAQWLEQAREMGIAEDNAAVFEPTVEGLELAMCLAEERVGRARGR